MAYLVKEIFYSLQGEGVQSGRPAAFVRFSGCNLWSGREEDRERSPCPLCDTDFVGTDGPNGGTYESARDLAAAIRAQLPASGQGTYRPYVILTGGEPSLQVDEALVEALHELDWEIAIETNGTLPVTAGIDWVTVSPKAGTNIVVRAGNELKLLFPQVSIDPLSFEGLRFNHFILQPVHGPNANENTYLALAWCLAHPRWRLGLQMHKILGIK